MFAAAILIAFILPGLAFRLASFGIAAIRICQAIIYSLFGAGPGLGLALDYSLPGPGRAGPPGPSFFRPLLVVMPAAPAAARLFLYFAIYFAATGPLSPFRSR